MIFEVIIMNEDKNKVQVKDEDFIGPVGRPNTYTADLPEKVRKTVTIPDPSQRVAYVNPNHSWV
jgi:hypothetical protein